MTADQEKFAALLKSAVVIPVLTIERLEDAVPLASALVTGGVRVLEVTLRTPVAIEAARAIMAEVPEAMVGIGTILNPDDLARAKTLGARFGISPGATPDLLKAAAASGLPFAPGIATASELMQALAHGFNLVKFFPAEQSAGSRRFAPWPGPFRMSGFARPVVSARPMPRRGWPSPTLSRWAVPGCARPPISGPATGTA
jgi:2-dehydro-3-deoxyphosphogluconate aldolase/(4S)-4-hydroxy-2-oxoglutarate aldolase